jgi:hypothetical protein
MKRLPVPDRSLNRLSRAAAAHPNGEGAGLAAWLGQGHAVSQKWRDAEALLRLLAGGVDAAGPPTFTFEHSQFWQRFRARADASAFPPPRPPEDRP